jgi:hypothetical protein
MTRIVHAPGTSPDPFSESAFTVCARSVDVHSEEGLSR